MPSHETPLSPEILEQIRHNSPKDLPPAGHYDLLVSLAGFSPQTTAQAYLRECPKFCVNAKVYKLQGAFI